MPEIIFNIEPKHVAEAIAEGKTLRVRIFGDRLQFKRVTVEERPK